MQLFARFSATANGHFFNPIVIYYNMNGLGIRWTRKQMRRVATHDSFLDLIQGCLHHELGIRQRNKPTIRAANIEPIATAMRRFQNDIGQLLVTVVQNLMIKQLFVPGLTYTTTTGC